jgi:GNAT superfamily N-acetyltransferase
MVVDSVIREATPADVDGIVAVARAHGFDGIDTAVDADYRQFIASHGRLAVAVVDRAVVGFGGAIDADGVCMVTDLFLLEEHQGRGLGAAMLNLLVAGTTRRMTFSSAHQAALPAYRRVGMRPRWNLQYWLGRASASVAALEVVDVVRHDWQGDRGDLADHWSAQGGRLLHILDAGRLVGWSIVTPTADVAATWTIARLSSDLPHDLVMHDVLSVVPAGDSVLVCTPDRSAARELLARIGFDRIDQDICCTTDGVEVAARLAALHPGLS